MSSNKNIIMLKHKHKAKGNFMATCMYSPWVEFNQDSLFKSDLVGAQSQSLLIDLVHETSGTIAVIKSMLVETKCSNINILKPIFESFLPCLSTKFYVFFEFCRFVVYTKLSCSLR